MRRPSIALALSLLCPLLAAPGARAADALTLEAPAQAVEEAPLRIVARGEAGPDRRLFVYTEPGTAGCAPTPAEEKLRPAAVEHTYRYMSPPSFLDVVTPTFEDAGPQQVCAYLGAAPDEVPAAVASAAIAVRAPAVRLQLRRRSRVVRLAGSTEIPRRLFAYAGRGRQACAADAEREASRPGAEELVFRSVTGAFRQTMFLPRGLRGRGRVCAYAAEAQDAAADARASLRVRL